MDADAALMASTSYRSLGSRLRTVTTTWISLRRPDDERRAQRAVDQTAGQDRVGGRPALAAEERAGDASRGVHPLFDVDGQREEVEMIFGGLAGGGRRQQHGLVVEVGDDGAGGLLGQPTGLETDGAGAEAPVVDDGGRFEHAVVNFNCRHRCRNDLSGGPPRAGFPYFWVLLVQLSHRHTRAPRNPGNLPANAATAVDRSGRSHTPTATTEDRPTKLGRMLL